MTDFVEFANDHLSHTGTGESLVIGFLLERIQQQELALTHTRQQRDEAEADIEVFRDTIGEAYDILHGIGRTTDQRLWAILSLVDALYEAHIGPLPLPPIESGLTPETE